MQWEFFRAEAIFGKLSVDQKIPILFVWNIGFEKNKENNQKKKNKKRKKKEEKTESKLSKWLLNVVF